MSDILLIILTFILLANGIVTSIAAVNTRKDVKYTDAYDALVRSSVVSMVASFIIGVTISLMHYYDKSSDYLNRFFTIVIVIILLVTGVFNADAAVRLQCHKDTNEKIKTAYNLSVTATSSSIGFAVLILFVQLYKARSQIRNKICNQNTRNPPPRPNIPKDNNKDQPYDPVLLDFLNKNKKDF